MLNLVTTHRGPRGIHRRQLLSCGGLAALGALTGDSAFAVKPNGKTKGFGKAKSVVLLFASGGQSQIDMWDPKPKAASHIRGQFKPIGTSLPSVHFTEHMPQMAKLAERYTVIRSMSHEDLDHGSACYLALTGHYHAQKSANPKPRPSDFPTYGAVLQKIYRSNRFPYDAVHVNGPLFVPREAGPGQNGGFLGRKYEPLVVGKVGEKPIAISGMGAQPGLPPVRLNRRLSLKQSLDRLESHLSRHKPANELTTQYQQALQMLGSRRCRQAFDMSEESTKTRNRYGRHRMGQACLLARRLVQAEVPYINVFLNHNLRGQDFSEDTDAFGWDTHNDIFVMLRDHLMPRFDQAVSAFLIDLEQRGLLDQTLVVCMGEFGRAPTIKKESGFAGVSPGRKHWAEVYSIMMAGAGVRAGHIVGASDRLGGSPLTKAFGPWDVAATMYSALGISPAGHFRDDLDRPFPIATGKPIVEAYG